MSCRTSLLIIGLVILILVVALAIMQPQWSGAATPAAPATSYPAPVATVAPTPTPAAPTPTAAPATATAGAVRQASPLAAPPTPASLRRYTYRVVNVFPHDPAAWTQGLVYADGVFYVGTGLTGQSSLRKVEPATGAVLQQHNLEEQYFGEGIALFGDKIYQLTWKNNFGFIYDKDTFAELGRFAYPTEGWGITHDGSQLIMSDGTPNLYFLDAQTLTETHRIAVTYQGQPLGRLNELEYFDGAIWANVWYTDALVRIDPATGVVTGVVDLRGLLSAAPPSATPADILNGIAYDETTGRIFVTGKFWPAVFEIELVEVTQ